MKRGLMIVGIIFMITNIALAQQRTIPHTDLTALPSAGESEIILKSIGSGFNGWFAVKLETEYVALVEPNIPEKIIVKNGFIKLVLYNEIPIKAKSGTGYVHNPYGRANSQIPCEIVVETKSDSTTMEIDLDKKGINHPRVKIVDVKPLAAVAVIPQKTTVQKTLQPAQVIGTGNIESALYKAGDTLVNTLPEKTTIAIISISSKDKETAEFVIEELAYILVNAGNNYKIVDRKSLGAIRAEQDFQMSGEVDDDSAVSIGKYLGANIVITGSISGTGSMQRLRVKALDVLTAQILAMASEAF